MKAGDTYDECLRELNRRVHWLSIGLICSGVASGCALAVALIS